MTGVFQGFIIKRNLEENPVDRNALNNLGGSPIADDIALFKNNKRNVSSTTVANSNINEVNDTIFFDSSDAVFTNNTKLLFNDTSIFYIKNSNGENTFQLAVNSDLSDTVSLSNSFSGEYVRSDEITYENISNYKKIRRPTNTNSLQDEVASNLPLRERPFVTNTKENILKSEKNIENFNRIKLNALITNKTFNSNFNFSEDGHSLIIDPDGVNDTGLSSPTAPGLFIYASNTKFRAFSDNSNVWKKNIANTYLETTSRKITVGTLNINDDIISIEQKPDTANLVIQASSPTNITTSVFTHKVLVNINGEDYYICLSNTGVVP